MEYFDLLVNLSATKLSPETHYLLVISPPKVIYNSLVNSSNDHSNN